MPNTADLVSGRSLAPFAGRREASWSDFTSSSAAHCLRRSRACTQPVLNTYLLHEQFCGAALISDLVGKSLIIFAERSLESSMAP